MTRREFAKAGLEKLEPVEHAGRYPRDIKGFLKSLDEVDPKHRYTMFGGRGLQRFLSHKYIIQQALSEGKTIPPEVLKDYPDLINQEHIT